MKITLTVETDAIAIGVERYRRAIAAAPNLPMLHLTQGVANGYVLAMVDAGALPAAQAKGFFEEIAGTAMARGQECLDEAYPDHQPAQVH